MRFASSVTRAPPCPVVITLGLLNEKLPMSPKVPRGRPRQREPSACAERGQRREEAHGAVGDHGHVARADVGADGLLELACAGELREPAPGVEIVDDGLLLLLADPRLHLGDVLGRAHGAPTCRYQSTVRLSPSSSV